MLTVVHAARRTLLVAGILATAFFVTSAGAADKRVIQSPNADYSGFDYSTVKNVTINQCQAACLADNKCAAFTYNPKVTWCFLKSDFSALSSSPGAIAGRVVAVAEPSPSLEKTRLDELAFLPSDIIDEARAIIGDLKMRYPNIKQGYAALRTAAVAAARAGRTDDAAADSAQALVVAGDAPGDWLDFARASLARHPALSDDQVTAVNDASAAAIDAYLRADVVADRVTALNLAGQALALREVWKPAIASYKASLALTEVASIRATYEKAVAEHGFRVINNTVEADSANPQVCVQFSDELALKQPNFGDFITVDGGDGLAVEPQSSQICVNGVKHGSRYTVHLRAGLPAADGEALLHPVDISMYVRDRAPWVGFAGTSYILPAGPDATIPISSVNTDTAKATIYRVGDRGIAAAIRDGTFLSSLSQYTAEDIEDHLGEKVWDGTIGIQPQLNQTVVTAIPIGDAVKDMQPGAYVLTAAPAGVTTPNSDDDIATQWFVVTDLGLTTLSGDDGIHVMVRSLATAKPVTGAHLRLIATNNEILGEATTDDMGYAKFAPGLARGTGGRAPQVVTVDNASDYAFIDLGRAAFDLSDRGVGGRPAPKGLDVFLTPERGIYRPGETVHLTALVRDAQANAVTDLPLTLTMERPDGVESTRVVLKDGGLGGYSDDVILDGNAMRGSWRVKLYTDPKADPIAETSVLVEDFEPERLAFDLTSPAAALDPKNPTEVDIAANYLYGAPAANLSAEGDISLIAADSLPAFSGYSFGLTEEKTDTAKQPLTIDAVTDADGKSSFTADLPDLPSATHPFTGLVTVRLADTNGRAVERSLSLPVATTRPLFGVKTVFSGDAAEDSSVAFDAILVGADGKRAAKTGVGWKLERVEDDYQWFRTNGKWDYELVSNATRVDSGKVDFTTAAPTRINSKVTWGDYRLTLEDDNAGAATSVEFYAGWYRAVASSETPDTLQVSLDKDAYRIGAQSASGTFNGDRGVLNSEFQTTVAEIDRQSQAIGLNKGGTFASNLSVFLGGGRGATSAAQITNGSVSVDLSNSTVDAASLKLKGTQAKGALAADVDQIVADTTNTTSEVVAGKTDFYFRGAGFADNDRVGVSVNLTGVTDANSLVTALNSAIEAAGNGGSTSATAFKNAAVQAKLVTNEDGTQTVAFESANAAFQVSAGDRLANALLGNATANVGDSLDYVVNGGTNVASTGTTFGAARNVILRVQGGSLGSAVDLTLAVTTSTTVASALSSLTSLVAGNSSLVAAGITVSQATSGSALQFTSKRGENFEVESVNDVTNVLGLGTAQNASGTTVSTFDVTTVSSTVTTGAGAAVLAISVGGGSYITVSQTFGSATAASDVASTLNSAFAGDNTLQQAGLVATSSGGTLTISSNNGTYFRVSSQTASAGFGFGTTAGVASTTSVATTSATTSAALVSGGASTSGLLAFSAIRSGNDDQTLTVSAKDSGGAQVSLAIKLQADSTATHGRTIDEALDYINTQLQASSNADIKKIVAVKERDSAAGGAEKIRFLSPLSDFKVSVGANPNTAGITTSQGAVVASSLLDGGSTIGIDSKTNAEAAVTALGAAVAELGKVQAVVGRGQNQFNFAISLAQTQLSNLAASESRIRDADLAAEAANLTKAQILQQAGIAALAQANVAPQAVLSLLRG